MKRYKIREKSIAWYAQKTWWQVRWCIRQYRKPIIATAVVVGLMVVLLASAEGNEPAQANTQEPIKTCSVGEISGFTPMDVPLDVELQEFIFGVAEDYGLEGELVMAVIGQESNYRHCLIGDDGKSKGLMQVQEKWHTERMERMKVTDLMNPYENVIVGVDYLAECIEKGGLEWGLMAYNGGASYANEKTKQGVISEYAESVLFLYELLKGGN